MSYKLNKITPIKNLGNRDLRYLDMAIEMAEKSLFDSSKRLGAVLLGKGIYCF
jgi:hypothetical protein